MSGVYEKLASELLSNETMRFNTDITHVWTSTDKNAPYTPEAQERYDELLDIIHDVFEIKQGD